MRSSSWRKRADAVADAADLLLVEAAGLVAAIARDEGDGVSSVEQSDRPGDGVGIDCQFTREACVFSHDHRCHERQSDMPQPRRELRCRWVVCRGSACT